MLFKRKIEKGVLFGMLMIFGLLGMASMSLAQADTWTTKTPMLTERSGLSASVVDGKIYAIGGATNSAGSGILSTVEMYDPATDTWTPKASMSTARFLHCSAAVNGIIYVFGGDSDARGTVEAYDPATDRWTTKSDMSSDRGGHKAAVVNGKIYVTGGTRPPNWPALKIVEEYDPATDTWTRKADMPIGRWSMATSVVDGIIYAIGGQASGGSWSSTMYAYNPATDTWIRKPNMPTGRTHFSACAVNGIIFAIGGGTTPSVSLSTVEAYDPATDTWDKNKENMPTARFDFGISAVDGKIYIIGGAQVWRQPSLPIVEEYDTGFVTSVENDLSTAPISFALHQNYPNPFNPETRISYEVSKQTHVMLQVMNVLGQKVRTLVNEEKPAGCYHVLWDGKDNHGQRVASNVYLYRLEAKGSVQTRKMVLLQ